jgi:hypothetical protein
MTFLGALEHGIYVDDEDDECLGMSVAQIRQYYGLDKDSDEDEDAMSAEKDEIHDVGDEDSMIDDAEEDVSDEDSIDGDEEDSMINDAEEDVSDEDSIDDDAEDLLGYLSEGEDEEMQDFGEREEDSTIVCVYPLFMDISFMRKFSRSLPLGIMRVASTMSQSPFRSIHLPLKIGLNFIKSLLKILNF